MVQSRSLSSSQGSCSIAQLSHLSTSRTKMVEQAADRPALSASEISTGMSGTTRQEEMRQTMMWL